MEIRSPELKIALLGLPMFLVWEIVQSPFFTDTFEDPWDRVLYNRIHCSGGDVMILLGAFWLVAVIWGRQWIVRDGVVATVSFLIAGVSYTVFSEYYNVSVARNWDYSRWMPAIGSIGLVPIFQWPLVPSLIIRVVRSSNSRNK